VVNLADDYEDVGLQEAGVTNRLASIAKCSCQFDKSSGLDLCRHRIAIMQSICQHIQIERLYDYLGVAISPKWLVQDNDNELEALRSLRNMPVPAVPRPNVTAAATPVQTKMERFALVMSELRIVADTASQSPAATEELLKRATQMQRELMNGTFVAKPELAPRVDLAAAAHAAAQELHRENNADALSLRHALGLTRQEDSQVTDDEWFNSEAMNVFMLQKEVAYKYHAKGKGGWHVGKIIHMHNSTAMKATLIYNQDGTTSMDARPNFTISFYSDEKTMDVPLYKFNRAINAKYESEQTTWALLKLKTMDDNNPLPAGVHVVGPSTGEQARKGKKESKRKAPHEGPTARNAPRSRGKQ
jgi:hypothetical protein